MKNFKIILRVAIFILVGILIFLLITPIFIPKWIQGNIGYNYIIKGFYEEPKNSLDIIFVGNSGVYRGISPIKMWENYGFTSYVLGSPAQKIWHSYYTMQEVVKYQKPKVIVLDVDAMFSEWKTEEGNQRKLYDNMKFSFEKIAALKNPVDKNNSKKIFSYIFPFFRYHSRWNSLEEKDFTKAYSSYHYAFKGMYPAIGNKKVKPNKLNYMNKVNKKDKIGKNAIQYFEKIIQLCNENQIQLQLIEMPSPDSWSGGKYNEIQKIVEKYHIEFIDLNKNIDKIGIDWQKDSHDGGSHLNVDGAEKTSVFLGKYLMKKYSLKDHRNDSNFEQWEKDKQIYYNYIEQMKTGEKEKIKKH